MRIPFTDVFAKNEDGSFSPRHTIQFGEATLRPTTTLRQGMRERGFDIGEYVDKDEIEAERLDSGEIRIHRRQPAPTG